jgi:hypothetical protein
MLAGLRKSGEAHPKPDFAVGLKASAFTPTEYENLMPYIGGFNETCFVKVTNDILFPFISTNSP